MRAAHPLSFSNLWKFNISAWMEIRWIKRGHAVDALCARHRARHAQAMDRQKNKATGEMAA